MLTVTQLVKEIFVLFRNPRSDHNPPKSDVPSNVSLHPPCYLRLGIVIPYWTQTREDHYFSAVRECLITMFTGASCPVTVSRWWGRVMFWNREIQSSWISAIKADKLHKQAVRSVKFWNCSQYMAEWMFRLHFSLASHLYSESFSLIIELLKPTGYVMHHQFNIQQLYALPTLYLCVLYLSENKQRLVPLTA